MKEINEMNGLCSDLCIGIIFQMHHKKQWLVIGTVQLEASPLTLSFGDARLWVRKFNVCLWHRQLGFPVSWCHQMNRLFGKFYRMKESGFFEKANKIPEISQQVSEFTRFLPFFSHFFFHLQRSTAPLPLFAAAAAAAYVHQPKSI
jgi:hypothetical protein